jgi:hypothetical protein
MPRDPLALTRFPPRTRVSPPQFAEDVAPVYARALDALLDDGVGFLVGGALALNHHTGIWRDTKDLDVFCRPEDAARVLAALARADFDPQVVYESWLAKAWEDEVFVDVIWRNANGLFPVTDAWFEHAPRGVLMSREVRMLPVEELLLSKMMVGGRHRFDGADVLHVLYRAHDRIDWARLEEGAGEHVGLLVAYLHMFRWGYPESAEFVPEDVLARFERKARTARSSFGAFRALLLDIPSFQVDVESWGLPDPHAVALARIFGDAEGRS